MAAGAADELNWESSSGEEEEDEHEHGDGETMEVAVEQQQLIMQTQTTLATDDDEQGIVSVELLLSLRRGALPPSTGAALRFMLVDLDIGVRRNEGTQVTFFGRCEDGRSVAVKATGWCPYLYVTAPDTWRTDRSVLLGQAQALLEEKLQSRLIDTNLGRSLGMQGLKRNLVRSVENHKARSIMGYSAAGEMGLLKVSVASPALLRAMRECIHGYQPPQETGREEFVPGFHLVVKGDGTLCCAPCAAKTFNSNLEPIMQFMSDLGIAGGQWCSLRVADATEPYGGREETTCDMEFECSLDALTWHSLEKESGLASVRTLSFDIEVAGEKGVFPDANVARWPVIQIALAFHSAGAAEADRWPSVLLSFKACEPIDGQVVLCFEDERALLRAFADLVVAFDPDVMTGYNVNDFDFMYIVTRAKWLDENAGSEKEMQHALGACSRVRRRGLQVEKRVFQSAQLGRQNRNKISMPGRVVLDVFVWVRENYKLEGYALKAVCAKFLKDENKEDVSFTEITPMWEAGPDKRKVLGVYCLKDAELPILLMQKLSVLFNLVERSRVSCMLPRLYVERGTMVRFNSQLIPEANAQGYVIPFIASVPQGDTGGKKADRFQGATVLESVRGMHANVAVLDFASLYPSIMMAYNLCFSTIVLDKSQRGLDLRGSLSHAGCMFVSPTVRKGVVPVILERLVATRKRCKQEMEKPGIDEMTHYLLDRRQEALKISCNSIYGAVGCRFALLPKPEIAKTVTGMGRQHIWAVKTLAERLFSVANGYERDAVVVGGDTDSVFVDMPVPAAMMAMELDAVDEAFRMADMLAAEVNATLTKPMKIEVEKVYSRLLLMKKKHYAGRKYKAGEVDKPPSTDIKGMECVRRDGCPLIRELVREVLDMLIGGSSVEETGALVRARVLGVLQDELPLDVYVIKKTLRKDAMSCMHELTQQELCLARGLPPPTSSAADKKQNSLSYAELDDAIRKGLVGKTASAVNLRWKQHLPQVAVAWKQRLVDPGSAPVPGLPVQYVVSLNGGKSVCDKVEALDAVHRRGLQVDREHYLKSLRNSMDGIFEPIYERRIVLSLPPPAAAAQQSQSPDTRKRKVEMPIRGTCALQPLAARAAAAVEALLWRSTILDRSKRGSKPSERQRAAVKESPIARAFARAPPKPAVADEQ